MKKIIIFLMIVACITTIVSISASAESLDTTNLPDKPSYYVEHSDYFVYELYGTTYFVMWNSSIVSIVGDGMDIVLRGTATREHEGDYYAYEYVLRNGQWVLNSSSLVVFDNYNDLGSILIKPIITNYRTTNVNYLYSSSGVFCESSMTYLIETVPYPVVSKPNTPNNPSIEFPTVDVHTNVMPVIEQGADDMLSALSSALDVLVPIGITLFSAFIGIALIPKILYMFL